MLSNSRITAFFCTGSSSHYTGIPPVATPVTPPVVTPVTPPVATPVAAPVTTPVAPPVTTPVTKPVLSPVTQPVFAPVGMTSKDEEVKGDRSLPVGTIIGIVIGSVIGVGILVVVFLKGGSKKEEIRANTFKEDVFENINISKDDACLYIDKQIPMSVYRERYLLHPVQCNLCSRPASKEQGSILAFQRDIRTMLVHSRCAEYSSKVDMRYDVWKHVIRAVTRGRSLNARGVGFMELQLAARIACAGKIITYTVVKVGIL